MDFEARKEAIQGLGRRIEHEAEVQRVLIGAHVEELEKLEAGFGLDLDVFTDIYGISSLDGTQERAQKLLENWQRLYTTLLNHSGLVAGFVNTGKEPILRSSHGPDFGNIYSSKGFIALNFPSVAIAGDSAPALILSGGELFEIDGIKYSQVDTITLAVSSKTFLDEPNLMNPETVLITGDIDSRTAIAELCLAGSDIGMRNEEIEYAARGFTEFIMQRYIEPSMAN